MRVFPKVTVSIELAHPHDLLTRYFLIDIELFASLLEYYGNTRVVRLIDFGSLRCESPTTIDDHLKEVIGDLRFSAKFKNGSHAKVFLFFEHQSKKVKRFCLRCIRKLLEFYESCETNPKKMKTRDGKYPYSLVVVLYHGKIPWKKMLQMGDLVSLPPGANRHFLSVPVILIDSSLIQKENLNGPPALVALLDTLQSASQGNLPENFDRIVGYFEEVKDDPRTSGWLNSLTRYFLAVTKTNKEVVARTLAKVLNKKEAEKMVTSTLEELFLKGIKKGKKEGKKEGKIQAVLKVLKVRFKKVPASISQSVNLYTDLIALESLLELAASCETLAEFERELAH
jgi:predicted transposase/invertase (TIGR01784 family)